jgi:hypothetical protein
MALMVARSGADMCPACSMRRAWPLALMRSADRVPINSAGSRPRPIIGLSPSSVTTEVHQLLITLAITCSEPTGFRLQSRLL